MVKFIIEQLKQIYRKSILVGAVCCWMLAILVKSGTIKGVWYLWIVCFVIGWIILVGWCIEEFSPIFKKAYKKLKLKNKSLSDKVAEAEKSFGVK